VTGALVVEQAGYATVQDLGRPGLAHLGISANGAGDAHAARTANVLVGNREGAPLLEATASALALRARRRLLIAVTGAAGRLLVDGVPAPVAEPVVVQAGSTVAIEPAAAGARSYVAVNGEIAANPVLGSVAPDATLGIGRRLAAGDVVAVGSRFRSLDHPYSRIPLFRLGAPGTAVSDRLTVDVTPGPDESEFDGRLDDGPARSFTVSPQSDAIGLRLTGPAPRRTRSHEILSHGVPIGAVEAPPGGGLIVLLRGRFVSAGYPIVAVATATAIDRLGQVRPGDALSFRVRTVADAVAELRRREDELHRLAGRVRTAFGAAGIGSVVDPAHLSTASTGTGAAPGRSPKEEPA
jgi:5-oxoprolinase (ATP-hydrolysing) subunit C